MIPYLIVCIVAFTSLILGTFLSKEKPKVHHVVYCFVPILHFVIIVALTIYLFDAIFKRTGPCKWGHDFKLESERTSRVGRASHYKCTRCNESSFEKEQYI